MKNVIDKLIRIVVSLLPRNKKLIVYGGSWDLFIDNAKYQFILNNEMMPDYTHVWLTSDDKIEEYLLSRQFHVLQTRSLRGMFTLLRAGCYIFDDCIDYFANVNLSEGAIRINLYHGVPNKTIMYDHHKTFNKSGVRAKMTLLFKKILFKNNDYLVTTSQNLAKLWSTASHIPIKNLITVNYARNYVLLLNRKEREMFVEKYESNSFIENYKKIEGISSRKVIYMPTFRDGNPDYLNDAIPNWTELNSLCARENIIFYLKVHRITQTPSLEYYSNIRIIDSKIDVYPILPLFDLLVTDYSSIMYDFSLTEKKIVLYTYDEAQYNENIRGVYPHYYSLKKELTCADNFASLLSLLSADWEQIKKFPYDYFFNDIRNFKVIPEFIRNKS